MRDAGAEAMPFAVALTAHDLSPSRAGRMVAAGIGFSLRPGDALVLRGANGSGKTSILRAVAGLAEAEGDVSFEQAGTPLDPAEARATAIHILAPGEGLADRLAPKEQIVFWAALDGVRADGAALLARVGLEDAAERAAGRLSTGQRRRLGLARLLVSPRPLWLLDEPLSGLDEEGRALLLSAAADHRAQGGIVLMATHEPEGLPGAPTLRLERLRPAEAAA